MNRPKFPEYVDSTMRASFVGCPRKFYSEYMLNRRVGDGQNSIHLIAGKAFATGVEETKQAFYRDNHTAEEALIIGTRALIGSYREPERFSDQVKSLDNMIGALDDYFQHYGWETDHFQPLRRPNGDPAIEFSFALPLPEVNHPVSGLPIIYCGRADWLGVHQDTGIIYAVDEKTTSRLGPTWGKQWRHRGQFTGYVYAGREAGIDVQGAVVRGISILKKSYGHAEVMQVYSRHYLDRWMEQLQADVRRMISLWDSGKWDFNFSDSCYAYMSPCSYSDACSSRDPDKYLMSNLDHLKWNPLKHQVERLDDDDNVIEIVE